MDYRFNSEGDKFEVFLQGEMTKKDIEQVNKIVKMIDRNDVKDLCIDMSDIKYIDSSGMGQLLVLKDKMDKIKGALTIYNLNGYAKKMVEVANFDKLLEIK